MQNNRIALVTGANQGQAVAKGIGAGAVPLQLDVTDRASIAAAAGRIRREFGRLDLLVNNAAISNTRKQQLGLSLIDYAKISLASYTRWRNETIPW